MNRPISQTNQHIDANHASGGKLQIHIQRLSLPGYNLDQQRRFTQTLQSEMIRLAQQHWPNTIPTGVNHLDAGQLRTGASPEDAARQVAARLFNRLNHQRGGNHP